MKRILPFVGFLFTVGIAGAHENQATAAGKNKNKRSMNKSKQNNVVKRFLTLACIKLFYMLSNQLLFMRQLKFTFSFFVAIFFAHLRIHAQAPNISYTGSPYSFATSTAIIPLTPTNSGSAVPATTPEAVSTFAGSGTPGSTNGTGTAASFSYPQGVAVDAAGNVYVSAINRIRKITSAGVVSTFAGSGAQGSTDATGIAASFNFPSGIEVDAAGNVYVVDQGNHKIRKITSAGVVSTLAGSGTAGSTDGPGISASFNYPQGVAVDAAGNVYVADRTNHKIRKITSAGVVSTFAGSGAQGSTDATGIAASFNFPSGIEVDAAGNVYVVDQGNDKIRKITSAGVVSTFAGSGAQGSADGSGTIASFNVPYDVAIDALGNVYVGEFYKIRKITSVGVVSTFAGMGWPGGSTDATGIAASFSYLMGVALDATGNIYVADQANNKIRKISLYGYSISPALPAGLSFDATTGIINGTPNIVSPATNYTITASNASGTSTVVINMATVIPPPTITNITPASGTTVPGLTVTLTGTNFNTTVASNIVHFGAVKATVTAATATSLTVTAPVGATYAPVTAFNTALALAGSSTKPFLPTFAGKGRFTLNDIMPKVDFATTGTQQPYYVAIGDIDGDGKPDLAVANYANGTVSVYRNTSTSGSITTASFAARVDFATGTNPISVSIGDLDGDGKPELAVANYGGTSVSVFRNTATSGTINLASFAAKVDYTTGSNPRSVAIVDLDADGKPDLAVANTSVSTVSILRNASATGTISFLPKVDYATGANPHFVAFGDLDGDGKPDLATANNGNASVSVLRNTSVLGAPEVGTKVDFTAGTGPVSLAIGDLDADGKAELVVTNFSNAGISVLKNTAVSGFITSTSFAAKVDFATGAGAWAVAIGDLDGDGKPDLAVANAGVSTVSVLRNTSNASSITASSFAAKVDFATVTASRSVAIGDLDGDGKPDFVAANYTNATISVFRNNPSGFITFNVNGGTGTMDNQKISYLASDNLTANAFIRSGYSFAGWNTAPDGTGTAYVNLASYTMGATDGTLYAQWTAGALPVNFISITASRKTTTVQVNWKVGNELNIHHYEVERSVDGRNYSKIGTVVATAVAAYNFLDVNAPAVNIFYRVKNVENTGESKYSAVAKLYAEKTKPGYAVAPNPIVGTELNVQFKNQLAGKYQLKLLNYAGQQIQSTEVNYTGGNGTQTIQIPSGLARGAYHLEIISAGKTSSTISIFINNK